MSQPTSFVYRQLNDALSTRRETEFAVRCPLPTSYCALHTLANLTGVYPQFTQYTYCHTVLFTHQTEQQVFRADVVVIQSLSFFLRQREDPPRTFSEPIEFICHYSNPLSQYLFIPNANFTLKSSISQWPKDPWVCHRSWVDQGRIGPPAGGAPRPRIWTYPISFTQSLILTLRCLLDHFDTLASLPRLLLASGSTLYDGAQDRYG